MYYQYRIILTGPVQIDQLDIDTSEQLPPQDVEREQCKLQHVDDQPTPDEAKNTDEDNKLLQPAAHPSPHVTGAS